MQKTPKLSMVIGTTPQADAIKNGQVSVDGLDLDIVPNARVLPLLRPMVRDRTWDICEMAVMTAIMAVDYKRPISLVPAVMLSWDMHPHLAYNVSKGKITPKDIEGKRVGVRSYTQTTGCWLRGILQNDFEVDLSKVNWVTFEDAHIPEYRDPPFAKRAPEGKNIRDMLLDGELDCAIIAPEPDPRMAPMFPAGAGEAWARQVGFHPINHMMCVKTELFEQYPSLAADLWELLLKGRKAAGLPADKDPYGISANYKALALSAKFLHQQGLISRHYEVEELFHPSTLKTFA
jgi:4,5-dihydroxyphthalate decarboxylase